MDLRSKRLSRPWKRFDKLGLINKKDYLIFTLFFSIVSDSLFKRFLT
jgi:hypothetical protein